MCFMKNSYFNAIPHLPHRLLISQQAIFGGTKCLALDLPQPSWTDPNQSL